MKRISQYTNLLLVSIAFVLISCQKEQAGEQPVSEQLTSENLTTNAESPPFNMQVILRGNEKAFGHIKFRQDNDAEKVITLDIWVRDLAPDHDYLLQRAVDAINIVDGVCTSTSWLTLGKGLTPQSIHTDANGEGREQLWRDISAVPSGSKFDIHFRVLDATNMSVVLTSDCYEYVVR